MSSPEFSGINPEQFSSDLTQLWDLMAPLRLPILGDLEDSEAKKEWTTKGAHWFKSETNARILVMLDALLEPVDFTSYYKKIIHGMFVAFKSDFQGIYLSHTPIDELLVGKTATHPDQARNIEEDALRWYLGYEKVPGESWRHSLSRRHLERYIKGGKASVLEREARGQDFISTFGLNVQLEYWEAEFVDRHGYLLRHE